MARTSLLHQSEHHDAPDALTETGYEALARSEADGVHTITFQVEGVHCAGCIQKIESRLSREADVESARLNFSTGRLAVRWKGLTSRANDFAQAVAALGYGVRPYDVGAMQSDTREEEKFLLFCLGLSGFAVANMMILSDVFWIADARALGMGTMDFMHWVSAAIALPTTLIAGRPFFRSAYKALSARQTNMDVPISLALILTCIMSLWETVRHGPHVYFDSAVMLIFFLLIGRYLDARTRRSARSTATDLLSMMTGFATVIEDGNTRRVPIRDLREEMRVQVAVGEKFPADGKIGSGSTEIDTSLVTGETVPRAAAAGANVYAGTVNLSAPVTITVAKAAEDSLLSDIVRLMEKAGQGQARYVRLAEKASALYTPLVHLAALLTFLLWWLGLHASWQDALMVAVTVLIITCPCALGLAVPVVQVLATGQLIKAGILIKSGDAFERLSGINSVFFDKTGTLTLGQPRLIDAARFDPSILALASALAAQSRHPLCRALASVSVQAPLPALEDVKERAGQGMEASWLGKTVRLGSREWCGDMNAQVAEHMELWLAVDGRKPVAFNFDDEPRSDAQDVVNDLQASGLNVTLLSGDRATVVAKVAQAAGINDFAGETTPIDKVKILEQRKAGGAHVLMVGDGLNDAPVLAGADVSMSPSTAIDMAQNAADIIFMGDRIRPVSTVWRTAVFAQKLVRQNLFLAIVYNLIAVPLAVAGMVTPLIASVAMSSSSIIVIANSFRLRRLN